MLIDNYSRFADKLAFSTAGTGSSKFGEDMFIGKRQDIGQGNPLYLVVLCSTALNSASGTATLTLQFVTADNAALTTNVDVLATTGGIAIGPNAVAGSVLWEIALPRRLYRPYIGLRQVIGTQALTAGAASAFLTMEPDGWRAYESNTGLKISNP